MINIQKNIPLAPFTTFKIGGPARFFCEVSSEEELLEALQYARNNDLKFFILGGGSNILVSDEGFDGLVIKIRNTDFELSVKILESNKIECWAGNTFSSVVGAALENGLTGLEWAVGVPGNIAGAIRGNAGCFGGEIFESVKKVEAVNLNDMSKKVFDNKECEFSYRSSIFKKNSKLIIANITLELSKGDKKDIKDKMIRITKERMSKQPVGQKCAGSLFKNPIVENEKLIEKFKKDTGAKCVDRKIAAAWLIEEVGLKGKKMGGVMVSEKHANFVVNLGAGTAQEVVMLASLIKMKVRDEFGVQLKEEIQYVGF